MEITQEDLAKLVEDAAKKGAESAVRAVNTVDEKSRPGGGKSAKSDLGSNVNISRPRSLNIGRALRGALIGWKRSGCSMATWSLNLRKFWIATTKVSCRPK